MNGLGAPLARATSEMTMMIVPATLCTNRLLYILLYMTHAGGITQRLFIYASKLLCRAEL